MCKGNKLDPFTGNTWSLYNTPHVLILHIKSDKKISGFHKMTMKLNVRHSLLKEYINI